MGLFCLNLNFSFWGRKLCETRRLRVLIRILRKFQKFQIEFRIFRVCRIEDVGLSRVVVRVYGLGLFQSYKSYCMHSHVICIRVDAAAEGAVYEVIAGPQEQRGQVQQENCEHPAQGPAEPSVEQQPEGKPRCTSYYLKL